MEFNFKPVKLPKRYIGERYKSYKHNNKLKRIDNIHPIFVELIAKNEANSFFQSGNYSHSFNEYLCFNELSTFKRTFNIEKIWDFFSYDFNSGAFKPFKHDLYSTINLKAKKDTSSIRNTKLPKITFTLFMRKEKTEQLDLTQITTGVFNDEELMPYVKYFNMGKV